jgi:hypothetical protein
MPSCAVPIFEPWASLTADLTPTAQAARKLDRAKPLMLGQRFTNTYCHFGWLLRKLVSNNTNSARAVNGSGSS